MRKTKEQLIKEHQKLNEIFVSKYGRENVVNIAHKMCQIEDILMKEYGFDLFEDLNE